MLKFCNYTNKHLNKIKSLDLSRHTKDSFYVFSELPNEEDTDYLGYQKTIVQSKITEIPSYVEVKFEEEEIDGLRIIYFKSKIITVESNMEYDEETDSYYHAMSQRASLKAFIVEGADVSIIEYNDHLHKWVFANFLFSRGIMNSIIDPDRDLDDIEYYVQYHDSDKAIKIERVPTFRLETKESGLFIDWLLGEGSVIDDGSINQHGSLSQLLSVFQEIPFFNDISDLPIAKTVIDKISELDNAISIPSQSAKKLLKLDMLDEEVPTLLFKHYENQGRGDVYILTAVTIVKKDSFINLYMNKGGLIHTDDCEFVNANLKYQELSYTGSIYDSDGFFEDLVASGFTSSKASILMRNNPELLNLLDPVFGGYEYLLDTEFEKYIRNYIVPVRYSSSFKIALLIRLFGKVDNQEAFPLSIGLRQDQFDYLMENPQFVLRGYFKRMKEEFNERFGRIIGEITDWSIEHFKAYVITFEASLQLIGEYYGGHTLIANDRVPISYTNLHKIMCNAIAKIVHSEDVFSTELLLNRVLQEIEPE